VKRKIWQDFMVRRLSVLGLARKYAKTVEQIEEILRLQLSRRPSKTKAGESLA
jgi:hypothetical protein